MIYNHLTESELEAAKNKHMEGICEFIKTKKEYKTLNAADQTKLSEYIYALIREKPDVLFNLSKKINKDFSKKNKLEIILNYDSWDKRDVIRYNPYHLAENLKTPTCPYCNRLYTKTVRTKINTQKAGKKGKIHASDKSKNIIRPTFDHWFPKSKYPLLALSFYNLIPSCNICNSLKHNLVWCQRTDFHPYLPRKKDNLYYRFSYKLLSCDDIEVELHRVSTLKESVHAAKFTQKLKDIYKAHRDEVEDLIRLRRAYSESYLESLHKISGFKISIEEVYRLAFGTYPEEKNFHLRPLSKLKHDILQELGIFSPEE